MNYLVLEIHPAYAVLVDQDGRFVKAANLDYRVGDRVRDPILMRDARPHARRAAARAVIGLTALAACCCLIFFGYYRPNFMPYGTLSIRINPDIVMTASRNGRVLALSGRNADGRALVVDYDPAGQDCAAVADAMVARAIAMGYLPDGGTVVLAAESDDADWQAHMAQQIQDQLRAHYETVTVTAVEDVDDLDAWQDAPAQAAPPAALPSDEWPEPSGSAPVDAEDDGDDRDTDDPDDDDDDDAREDDHSDSDSDDDADD